MRSTEECGKSYGQTIETAGTGLLSRKAEVLEKRGFSKNMEGKAKAPRARPGFGHTWQRL
jgi:hypothetical protein